MNIGYNKGEMFEKHEIKEDDKTKESFEDSFFMKACLYHNHKVRFTIYT